MVRFSLKIRLALTVCLLLAGLLAVLGTATLGFFSGELEDLIGRQQFAILSLIAAGLDQKLSQSQQLIVKTAASLPPGILGDPDRAQAFFDQRLGIGITDFFDNGIFLFSPDGRLTAEWPIKPDRRGRDYSFRDYFRKTVDSGKPIISAPYRSSQAHHHPAISFTAPLFDQGGRLTGVLAGSIDLSKDNFLGNLARAKVGKSGYYYLFSTKRLMIMHPDPTRVMQSDIPPGANRLLDQALDGFEGSGETINSRGIAMLVSFKHLAATDWILAANYPQAEAYAPLQRALRYTLAGVLAALFFGALVSWLIVRRQIRPLQQLTRQVRALSTQPGLRQPLRVRGGDEIATLAEAFNQLLFEVAEQTALSRDRLAFLQTVLDSIPIPVYYKDIEGRFLGCNIAFELIFGITRTELSGKTIRDILPAPEAEQHLRIDAALLPQTELIVRSFEQTLTLADGGPHQIQFFKSAFRNSQGQPAGLVSTLIDITEHKVLEAALIKQQEFSENLLQNSAVACFVLDTDHRVLTWTRACEELTGISAQQVLGTNQQWKAFYPEPRPCMADLIIDNSIEQILDLYETFADSRLISEGLQAEGWFPNVGGHRRYLFFEAAPIRDSDGALIAAIETLQDLTSLKHAELGLRKSEESYRSLIELSPDAILVQQAARVVFVNRAAANLFGAETPEELAGAGVLDLIHPDFRDLAQQRIERIETRQGNEPYTEEKILRRDGSPVDVESSSSSVFYGGEWAVQTILRDITDRKELQEKIWQQANFDTLTGLPNRMLFHDRLRQAIEQAARENYQVGVLFIDLDHFKEINDTLGHEAGDVLLREVAARLSRALRSSDTLARMGGDEFTGVMPWVVELSQVEIVAGRLLESLAQPFHLPGGEGHISGSIGIALFPTDAADIPTLLKHADAAMYRSKQSGRNAYCFFGRGEVQHGPGVIDDPAPA